MRARAIIFMGLLVSICAGTPACADKRVALVIGNSAYQNVSRLPNPENDAVAIGLLLKDAGFDVTGVRQNLGNTELRQAIRDFSETTRDADMALVFFAGHGIEVGGANYLIPVDAKLKRDIDVEDEAVSLERVLTLLEPARRLRLVILDACRDNPFAPNMARTLASRSIGRGLAKVEPATGDTLVAFAAKAGSVAADGSGTNSPFTLSLLSHLTTPGLDIRIALGRVRDEVLARTGKRQEPFVYGALGGAMIYLNAKDQGAGGAPADRPAVSNADSQVAQDYEVAAKIGNKEAWDVFLAKHPTGFYADIARAQRNKTASLPPPKESVVTREEKKGAASAPAQKPKPPAADRSAQMRCFNSRWPLYVAQLRASGGEEAVRANTPGGRVVMMQQCRNAR